MKHVFFIMNNINKRISESWVIERGLRENEVIFVYLRHGLSSSCCECSEFYFSNRFKYISYKNLVTMAISFARFCFIYAGKIDSYLEDIVDGDDFIAYLPHMYSDDFNFISSNSLCKGVVMVEEGDAAYADNRYNDPLGIYCTRRSFSYKLLNKIFFPLRGRLGEDEFYPRESFIEYSLGVSPASFAFYKKKIIVDIRKSFSENASFDGCVFLIDDLVSQKKLPLDEYVSALSDFLRKYNNHFINCDVLLSFHPRVRLQGQFKKEVLSVFCGLGIPVEEFCGDIELLAYNSKDLEVYGLVSSSMRYSLIMGRRVYSWADFLSQDVEMAGRIKKYALNIGAELSK